MSRRTFDLQYPRPLLGIDEVGVGCLAGPVVACGVVLPEDQTLIQLLLDLDTRDSKRMNEYTRRQVFNALKEYGVWMFIVEAPPTIFQRKKMPQVLDHLFRQIVRQALKEPGFKSCIIDGDQSRNLDGRSFHAVTKADDKSLTVACASVAAKAHRDQVMRDLHERHEAYGWDTNKGYPTKKHKLAIEEHGPVLGVHRTALPSVQKLIASRDGPLSASAGVEPSARRGPGRANVLQFPLDSGRFR